MKHCWVNMCHLIPVCSCRGHHWSSCSGPAAHCCRLMGPSCTWSQSLCPGEESVGWEWSVDLRGAHKDITNRQRLERDGGRCSSSSGFYIYSFFLPNLVEYRHDRTFTNPHTHTWCNGGGRLEASSLHDAAISVNHYQCGLLGTETLTQLEGRPPTL